MTAIPATEQQLNTAMLTELAEVKGQLAIITRLIQTNHDATHQRINDLRHSVDGRFDGVDSRLTRLEENERGTAIRTAAVGAVSGALVTAAIQFIKHMPN